MAKKFISEVNLYVAGILLLALFTISGGRVFAQSPDQSLGNELDLLSAHYKVSFVYEAQLIAAVKLNHYKRLAQPDLDLILYHLLNPLNLAFKKISDSQYIIKAAVPAEKIIIKPIILSLDEVAILGSHAKMPRTKLQTALPVDVLNQRTLMQTGQTDLAQMLHYTSSSFNSSKYGINNVASYAEQSTLRGLGPDQLLVLINGKRRYNIAALNLNNTVGKGTAGTDLSAIPAAMIEKIEILRDGAAAQYGSDAIAGIINIVLKKETGGTFSTQVGQTSKGDGSYTQNNLSYGLPLASGKGFLNFTLNYQYQQSTNRARAYTGLVYTKISDTAKLSSINFPAPADKLAENKRRDDLLVKEKGFQRNQGQYGDAEIKNIALWFNMETPVAQDWKFYSFGGFSQKRAITFGFYRFPNFYPASTPLFPDGYLPEFPAVLSNGSVAAGLKKVSSAGWNMDFSAVYGYNKLNSEAVNTVNASMGKNSPLTFNAGGTILQQGILNLDFSRTLTPGITFAAGAESRLENYQIITGDEASYLDANLPGTPSALLKLLGTNGRPGFKPDEQLNKYRANVGIYAEVNMELSKKTLIAATARYERYSDFGGNLSGKLAIRHRITDAFVFRTSLSRNFRAPSLQQVYYDQLQFQFFQKNGQSDVYLVQHFRNDSPVLQQLGIPKLRPETSINLSAGLTGTVNSSLSLSADFYYIPIRNRIVVSGRLDSSVVALRPVLASAGVTDLQFFINALNTYTRGVELTANYTAVFAQQQSLTINGTASFNRTKVKLKVASLPLAGGGNIPASELLPRIDIGIIEHAQPNSKMILSCAYQMNAFNFLLRNTYFGQVAAWENDPVFDQTFSGKVITDVQFSWRLNKRFSVSTGCNNLFNVYPDEIKEINELNTNLSFGGQIPYSRTANQFGFNGMNYYASLQVKF
ncbi:iron complex outermembrane receptor protein [Pedobacter cryoconitis]|uniref:Iron complex outermembrane receptor protein n=1 Tax=Pedobacter cryoconitis TaxID=188932 RepID=A0A7W8YR86_9SPHI|nr:TonB-dependent receptor [Pedobacter cryoconitis]MBB5620324.1 iron complex outermembrane receptor protein [Pedobacter cryoconitis]MBB5647134.1 iron complex outermembrane receptor protein [Pedobacter cryoconitis]